VDWENASADLVNLGVRLIHMRFGVILSKKGGALAKMLPAFYFGLGGKLGSGKQKMSWIPLDEIPYAVDYLIAKDDISGPVNMTAPYCHTNEEFLGLS
jgi:NAD dependent epimerase/dehydratase family enzyme